MHPVYSTGWLHLAGITVIMEYLRAAMAFCEPYAPRILTVDYFR